MHSSAPPRTRTPHARASRPHTPLGHDDTAAYVLRCAAYEFGLTAALLLLVVTTVRRLLSPVSPIALEDPDLAFATIGTIVGVLPTALILSPPGRRSGGHLNPAVTPALWRLGVFPGRAVLPYLTALGGLAWGGAARRDPIAYASVFAAPGWSTLAVCVPGSPAHGPASGPRSGSSPAAAVAVAAATACKARPAVDAFAAAAS